MAPLQKPALSLPISQQSKRYAKKPIQCGLFYSQILMSLCLINLLSASSRHTHPIVLWTHTTALTLSYTLSPCSSYKQGDISCHSDQKLCLRKSLVTTETHYSQESFDIFSHFGRFVYKKRLLSAFIQETAATAFSNCPV